MSITKSYELACEQYASVGVDVEKAVGILDATPVSLHCWQGDDCRGFEGVGSAMSGGILTTGEYPGKARNIPELKADLDLAMSLIPGPLKVNLHAFYLDNGGVFVDRNEIEPRHFTVWTDWAKEKGIGLDFNPTYFSHKYSADGATISSADRYIREFWIEHGKRTRRIADFMGKETGQVCIDNFWMSDGIKERPIDSAGPRERMKDALDTIFSEKLSHTKDAVESKLFGIGSEAYVVGSHEFFMGYAMKNRDVLLTLDTGHFHPTELVSAKLSALFCFLDELLLHVSRPIRWDSDHVVSFDDELCAIMSELVRADYLPRTKIALDFFDGSINRIAAWVIGTRNTKKALLKALLEPVSMLKKLEADKDTTARLALTEEYKSYPFGAVWDYYCEKNGVGVRESWLDTVRAYEKRVVAER